MEILSVIAGIIILIAIVSYKIIGSWIDWFFGVSKIDAFKDNPIKLAIEKNQNSRVVDISDKDIDVQSSYDSKLNTLTLILTDTINNRTTNPIAIKLKEFSKDQTEITTVAYNGKIEIIQNKTDDGGFEIDLNIKETNQLFDKEK